MLACFEWKVFVSGFKKKTFWVNSTAPVFTAELWPARGHFRRVTGKGEVYGGQPGPDLKGRRPRLLDSKTHPRTHTYPSL